MDIGGVEPPSETYFVCQVYMLIYFKFHNNKKNNENILLLD